jgi:hypothetical protein
MATDEPLKASLLFLLTSPCAETDFLNIVKVARHSSVRTRPAVKTSEVSEASKACVEKFQKNPHEKEIEPLTLQSTFAVDILYIPIVIPPGKSVKKGTRHWRQGTRGHTSRKRIVCISGMLATKSSGGIFHSVVFVGFSTRLSSAEGVSNL